MLKNYNDFTEALLAAGFSMGGGNSEGIYSIIPWNWNEEPPYKTPVCWHTGDFETDPWEWRIRVLNERDDVSYGKLFFKKSGYITKEWYPYFLAVRRGGSTFEEEYSDGKISHYAKRIYEVVANSKGGVPLEEIKRLGGFTKEDKSKFDSALTLLQMKLYIATCGSRLKRNNYGEEYGWASTMFCTTEEFWGEDVFEAAASIAVEDAIAKISEQILRLNPEAEQKKMLKFIKW